MFRRSGTRVCVLALVAIGLWVYPSYAHASASWSGVLSDSAGKPLTAAIVKLHSPSGGRDYSAITAANGGFTFAAIVSGSYELSVKVDQKELKAAAPFIVKDESAVMLSLKVTSAGEVLPGASTEGQAVSIPPGQVSAQASGGEHLSGPKFPVFR